MTISNWKSQVTVGVVDVDETPKQRAADMVDALLAAGRAFDARTDAFAAGKGATCRDMANKLAKYGEFASDAQAGFAAKLIAWAKPRAAGAVSADDLALADQLDAAAKRYDGRSDAFAAGKGATCRDIAARARAAGFASAKQREYAEKLVAWTSPRQPRVNGPAKSDTMMMPLLFAVMQKHADFLAGSLKVARRNQDSLCWITWNDNVIGRMDAGTVELWTGKIERAGAKLDEVRAILVEMNLNPMQAAQKYGRLSGRCSMCSRDLTDPESIEFGVGPICRARGF